MTKRKSTKAPLNEVERLYNREKWKVSQIAAHFNVSRQAIYQRLQAARVKLDPDRRLIDREQLRKLYVDQMLTKREIAEKLNVCKGKVSRDLKLHGIEAKIKTRPQAAQRRNLIYKLSRLPLGESLQFTTEECTMLHSTYLYERAKLLGMAITIRRVDDTTARLTRIK
jgi:predicted DNA-binding protein YlxM (UPF0122 family)